MGTQTRASKIAKILELFKGVTIMTKLSHDLSMSYRQLRRTMAELVDRGFFRFTCMAVVMSIEYIFLKVTVSYTLSYTMTRVTK